MTILCSHHINYLVLQCILVHVSLYRPFMPQSTAKMLEIIQRKGNERLEDIALFFELVVAAAALVLLFSRVCNARLLPKYELSLNANCETVVVFVASDVTVVSGLVEYTMIVLEDIIVTVLFVVMVAW